MTKVSFSFCFPCPTQKDTREEWDAEKSNHVLGRVWHHNFHCPPPETAERQYPNRHSPKLFQSASAVHFLSCLTHAKTLVLLLPPCYIICTRKAPQQHCRCKMRDFHHGYICNTDGRIDAGWRKFSFVPSSSDFYTRMSTQRHVGGRQSWSARYYNKSPVSA